LQQDGAFDHIRVVDQGTILGAVRLRNLSETNLGALVHDCDVFDAERRASLSLYNRVFNLLHVLKQAGRLHVDLLRAGDDEAAACVSVVVCQLLLDLPDA
jgi:hypothetical protein